MPFSSFLTLKSRVAERGSTVSQSHFFSHMDKLSAHSRVYPVTSRHFDYPVTSHLGPNELSTQQCF